MSKRYGRNQKRKARERIKQLEERNRCLAMDRAIDPRPASPQIIAIRSESSFPPGDRTVFTTVDMNAIQVADKIDSRAVMTLNQSSLDGYVEYLAHNMAQMIQTEALGKLSYEIHKLVMMIREGKI